MKKTNRGASLATTLVVAALMLTLGFTVAGVGFHHLNVSSRLSNVAIAENLSEAAVSKTIERLLAREATAGQLDFGLNNETVTATLPGTPSGALGVVSFDQSYLDSQSFDLDLSLNNLGSDTAVAAANGQLVPSEAIYLVGYGSCNGVERRVEAVVHVPRFPYSIASQGAIQGSDLLVAALKDGAVLPVGAEPDPDDLVPGHLVTNSSIGDTAVDLDGNNLIRGDLQSASGVDLSGGTTTVEGETRTFAGAVDIPDLDVTNYAPDPTDPATNTGLSSVENNLQLSGLALYNNPSSPLFISNGLTLNGGVLYVEGDVQISGGIHGKGAVIATGDISVQGGGSLATDNLAALLANGNVTIDGGTGSPAGARYEGLIYTEGSLSATDLTLVGVFVANNDPTSSGTVLRNAKVYEKQEYANLVIQTTTPGTSVTTGGNGNSTLGGVSNGSQPGQITPGGPGPGTSVPASISVSFDGQTYTSVASLLAAVEAYLGRPLSAAEEADLMGWLQGNPGGSVVATLTYSFVDSLATTTTTGGGTTTTGGGTSSTVFSLDLSDFLSSAERMRILYWRPQLL